jgi:hypothetical protein
VGSSKDHVNGLERQKIDDRNSATSRMERGTTGSAQTHDPTIRHRSKIDADFPEGSRAALRTVRPRFVA